MNKVAIIHFLPLEFYPPVTNMINVLTQENGLDVQVWSTHNNKNRSIYDAKVRINRFKLPDNADGSFVKLFKYFSFNIKCLFDLIIYKPDKVLYFETFSVWPVYAYAKFFNKNVQLFIHYHEYFSPEWYINGMRLVKFYHKLETSYLYKRAIWISQTNDDRMKMFVKDNKISQSNKLKILPNFPPNYWSSKHSKKLSTEIVKTVYIGTLSLEYSYIKEYCQWVILNDGKINFDIYGYNYNKETLDYLSSINSPYINFYKSGINYDNIPNVLKDYDVGVILYKAITDNFKYNAPNKLFEYLTCNLQVWYADKMLGIKPYDSTEVIPVNFEEINTFNYSNALKNRSDGTLLKFTAEEALLPLIEKFKE